MSSQLFSINQLQSVWICSDETLLKPILSLLMVNEIWWQDKIEILVIAKRKEALLAALTRLGN